MTRFSLKLMLLLLAAVTTLSAMAEKKQLRPVYFDNPAAVAGRTSEMPQSMKDFFAFYTNAMQRVAAGEDASRFFEIQTAATNDSVGPLLGNIEWGQGSPYNDKCPVINQQRAVTGCVATAMAQVMRYYKYPACGTGTVTYTGGTGGAKTIDLANYPFDYSNMLEQYTGNYTTAQGNAVATLMLACGAALNMNYSADGSGSNTAKVAGIMKNNFNYDSKARFIDLSDQAMTSEVFEDWGYALRDEFDAGHPVIFSGYPAVGKTGHCFIIDGYRAIDGVYYYHLNWGWEGMYNGYYLLTNLNPEGENYSGYGCVLVYQLCPPNWTGVETVENTETSALDASQPIYNILGQRVSYESLRSGNIYIQKGKKVIF